MPDYGRDLLVAKHIFESKNLISPATSIPSLNNTPFYYWIIGSFYSLFSGSAGIKIGFWLVGCGTILLGYIFGRNFNKFLGLIIATYIASSERFILYSTTIWQPHLVPFFILLWMCFLVKYYKKKQTIYLVLSVLALSGTFFLHYTGFLLLPAAITVTLYSISTNTNSKKQFVFFLLALLITLIAFVLVVKLSHNQLKNDDAGQFSMENLSRVAGTAIHISGEKINHVLSVLNRVSTLMLNTPLKALVALFGILLIKLNLRKKIGRHLIVLLSALLLSMGLLFFMPVKQVHDHYATSQIILVAFFPFLFFMKKNWFFYSIGILYLSFILLFNAQYLFKNRRELSSSSNHPNSNQLIAQRIISNSLISKKQISQLYTPNTDCQIVKTGRGENEYYCLYSDWHTHGVMYEIEKQLNASLVELVQYGSNIKPKYLQNDETISYLFCPPEVVKFCQTWVVNDPCVTPIDRVTTNQEDDFVQIYAITCRPKDPF
ncbi:MAG: glycosyltransferase family 39 protein [bacterium]|nr:glycosyltransferase family 39 protein [bacterium]